MWLGSRPAGRTVLARPLSAAMSQTRAPRRAEQRLAPQVPVSPPPLHKHRALQNYRPAVHLFADFVNSVACNRLKTAASCGCEVWKIMGSLRPHRPFTSKCQWQTVLLFPPPDNPRHHEPRCPVVAALEEWRARHRLAVHQPHKAVVGNRHRKVWIVMRLKELPVTSKN